MMIYSMLLNTLVKGGMPEHEITKVLDFLQIASCRFCKELKNKFRSLKSA